MPHQGNQETIDKAIAAVSAWKSGKTKTCTSCRGCGYYAIKTCGCDDFCDCQIVGFFKKIECDKCHGSKVEPIASEPTPEQYAIVDLINK